MKLLIHVKSRDGFSLLEVLLSMALIFIILFPLLGFFVQAYDYTMGSRNKTVAINVARNVINYMENQNILAMKAFYEIYNDENDDKFAILTWEDCFEDASATDKTENLIKIDDPEDLSKATDDCNPDTEYCFPLFTSGIDKEGNKVDDGSICFSVLAPEINNENFRNRVYVYLTEFYDNQPLNTDILDTLKEEKEETVRNEALKSILIGKTPSIDELEDSTLLKVYAVVDWHESRDNIVLEGVISDEALR